MDIQQILEGMQIFAGFTERETEAFIRAAELRSVPARFEFLRAGQANDSIFIVCRGAVRVEQFGAAEVVPLAMFRAGQAFGEMSFMDGGPATASVIAVEPTDVVVLSRQTIDRMIEGHAALALKFWRNLAFVLKERLIKTNEMLIRYADINQALLQDSEFRENYGRL